MEATAVSALPSIGVRSNLKSGIVRGGKVNRALNRRPENVGTGNLGVVSAARGRAQPMTHRIPFEALPNRRKIKVE